MNEKRRRFVEAYLTDAAGNATKAAEIAGYSPKTARQIGSRLLTYADVRQAVDARSKALAARADMTADKWAAEVDSMAFAKVEVIEARDKLKALELRAKQLNLIQPKAQGHSDNRPVIVLGFITHAATGAPTTLTIDTHALPPNPEPQK
jgi:hypothetical protein